MNRHLLRKLRIDHGFTQKEVANQLNLSRTAYQAYENGAAKPDIERLQHLADFFQVSLHHLLDTPQKDKVHLETVMRQNVFVNGIKLTVPQKKSILYYATLESGAPGS
jgi:transcriptional regulator with XRE-family HTH domain